MTSIRVDKWFIFFHNNDKGSIWTFTYLDKYCKKLKNYFSKESMGIKNPGSCFMKIDDTSEGDTLNEILINILEANNRTGDRHKKQLNVNSDNLRIKRIKCKLFKKSS